MSELSLDVPYDKNDNFEETTIKQSINTYVKQIVDERIDDTDILRGCIFDGFQDNYIEQQRIYNFYSTQDGKSTL